MSAGLLVAPVVRHVWHRVEVIGTLDDDMDKTRVSQMAASAALRKRSRSSTSVLTRKTICGSSRA